MFQFSSTHSCFLVALRFREEACVWALLHQVAVLMVPMNWEEVAGTPRLMVPVLSRDEDYVEREGALREVMIWVSVYHLCFDPGSDEYKKYAYEGATPVIDEMIGSHEKALSMLMSAVDPTSPAFLRVSVHRRRLAPGGWRNLPLQWR